MASLTKRSARTWIIITAAMAAGILALLPGGLQLKVTPVKGGAPLVVWLLDPGDRFTLHYYHSVEESPIWETHSVDDRGRIFIEEERYLKFGAGMGKMPGIGHMEMRGPHEVITDMHMPTGNFILRIGSPGVAHTLIYGENSTNLSELAPHTAVRFTAQPISMLRRLYADTGLPGTPQTGVTPMDASQAGTNTRQAMKQPRTRDQGKP